MLVSISVCFVELFLSFLRGNISKLVYVIVLLDYSGKTGNNKNLLYFVKLLPINSPIRSDRLTEELNTKINKCI